MAIVDPFATPSASSKGIVDPFAAPAERSWSDVLPEAVSNLPSSAYEAVAAPLRQTLSVVKAIQPLGHESLPVEAFHAAKAIYDDPSLVTKLPRDMWQGLVDRYGSEEALKKTIATDPAGFALDVGSLFAGGAGAIAKVGEIGRLADVSRPFYEGLPREPPAAPPAVPPTATPPDLPPVAKAVQELPRALTGNRFEQQAAQYLSKKPMGYEIGRAIEQVPEKFGEARNLVGDELGGYRTPVNVASDIREQIGGQAETETAARQAAARQADEAAQAAYEQANQQREAAIAQQEQRSTQAAQQQIGNVAPVNMGDAVIDTVRASHDNARNAKDAAYRDAANIDATVLDQANSNAHANVAQSLRADEGQGTVDMTAAAVKTARGMLARIRQFSNEARNRMAQAAEEAGSEGEPAQTGRSMRDIEQVRKDLNFAASGADNDADRRAARRIIQGFDQWHEDAMGHSLMEGSDPGALDAYRNARDLNRDFRERFGYNDRNDADTTLNKIVQGGDQIGPEDISKQLFAGGNKPTRLLDAIYQATGDHPNHGNVVQAIRGGFWNKLAGVGEGQTTRSPEKIASDIHAFMNRREMADRIYTPQEQGLARRHAETLRGAVQAREQAAALAKANRPVPTEVTKGPMQELADRVLGRGQRSDEALFNIIEGYAKAKGGGKDIETLARIMSSIPEELKGNFRNTFIRRVGVGLKGDFSPARFADEWTRISPQAKQVLFHDSAQVRALDELADASRTFDEVHRRFGNPSGSGHIANFGHDLGAIAAAMAAGTIFGPLKVLAGLMGTRGVANFLARPAGAASSARFARQMQRLQAAPTIANAAAARLSLHNLNNTALALGLVSQSKNKQQQTGP